jgi:lipopolysaccharide transport system permease protein
VTGGYAPGIESATAGIEPHVIRPAPRRPRLGLRELWRNRELLSFFAWRELKVRYKQTLLGVVWAVLQPVMYMVVFTLFFGKFAGLYSPGPYALLTLSGSVIWLFFANSVTLASGSLVGNASLLTKVWFPRLLAPIAPVIAALVDLALSTLVLLAVMAGYGYYPAPQRVWTAIPFVLLAMGTAVGVGAWLAALNVKYRDVRFVVPFVLQLWLFASAVFYSYDGLNLDAPWATLFFLNPLAGVVEGFRWALLGGVRPDVLHVALSTLSGGVVLLAGLVYFKRMERIFADIV